MAIDPATYYKTIADYDAYFAERLYEQDWLGAPTDDKERAALAATRAADQLIYAGKKTAVFDLLEANPDATQAEIDAADASQPLKFPRDGDTTIPDNFFFGVCEEARALISGRDPDQEFENLWLSSDGVGSTRVSSNRNGMPPLHTSHFLTSATAWKYFQEFVDPDVNTFTVNRVN